MGLPGRLRTLPRDARDTLFLLAVIAWLLLPQLSHLPLWCNAMTALVLAWRAVLAVQGRALPARGWLIGLLLLATGATLATHHSLLGRDAGVTFLVVLLALKTLELHARRDTFVVFFLGFFVLLSNFFYSQSLLTAAAMLVGLLGLLTALVNLHLPVGRPPLAQAARTAARMALLGAPIMVVLFVLFPRLAPLWGMPGDALTGRSGLSDQMQVGTIARLALDSSVALRIRFDGTPPPQSALYFRGPVLSRFDGRNWQAGALPPPPAPPSTPAEALQTDGPPVDYEITLEPSNQPWLPLLDASPSAPDLPGYAVRSGPALQWLVDRPLTERVRFKARAYPQFRYGPRTASAALRPLLDLPPGLNPRTQQLAQELLQAAGGAGSPASARVAQAMALLRSGGYRYTLEPGLYGSHTADEFWFDRKEGFCEHIASSFVLLMRAMGVPARVVTGYQGGEINGIDRYWTVRQSDAHAWAEVWLADQGWTRIDPTSAVVPWRVGALQRLQPPRSAIGQALETLSPQFTLQLRALWDATNNRWNQWVLNYSQARQLQLLRDLGFAAPGWEDLAVLLLGLLVAGSLLGAAWTQWERTRQDPWLRLLHAAQRRLQRAGWERAAQTTPRQLASQLQAAGLPDHARWLLDLEAWRYAPAAALNAAPNAVHDPAPNAAHAPRPDRGAGARTLGTLQRQYRQLVWPAQLPAPPATALQPSPLQPPL